MEDRSGDVLTSRMDFFPLLSLSLFSLPIVLLSDMTLFLICVQCLSTCLPVCLSGHASVRADFIFLYLSFWGEAFLAHFLKPVLQFTFDVEPRLL